MDNDNDRTESFVPLTKGIKVGHYSIVNKIGAGGMGEVYLAEDTKLKRKVALKFLPMQYINNNDLRERFTREARAVAALSHNNIVTIFEVSDFNNRPFFAMEHIPGQSLRDVIKKGKLKTSELIDLTMQICEGLHKAHEAGVVHRDIKPANIIIDNDGRAKILDFGLAMMAGEDGLTQTGSTLGTVGYMSPEQITGTNVDHRSDIFSVGVILYEMLTGRKPFEGDNDAAIVKAITDSSPEPVARFKSGVTGELQNIIDKALAKDVSIRYQHADGMLADLKRIAQSETKKRANWQNRYIVTGAVLALIIILLVVKPWQFEINFNQKAIAAENRLAIMYFDNLADPEDSLKWGEIATNLLITDLTESQYINVVSSQRLYDILKLLGREGEKRIDRGVATQVAEKAKAKQILLGSILQIEPQIIITSQLVDIESGQAIASQRITGEIGDNIFTVVDKITAEVKNDMSLPAVAKDEPDLPVADITTHSAEAYRYYLEGIDYNWKLYWSESERSLERALEFDSTFAMAYHWLAHIKDISGSDPRESLAKAIKYMDKISRKEKLYIRALELRIVGDIAESIKLFEMLVDKYPEDKQAVAILGGLLYRSGEKNRAIRYFSKAIEIDPLFKWAYNMLAYNYDDMGDFDKSIWAINKYIEIAPDEANPYDTRADLYAMHGKIEKAIEYYKKALAIKPDFYISLAKLGHHYLFQSKYADAENYYQKLSSSSDKNARSWGRTSLSLLPLYQGKFDKALEILSDGLTADRMEEYEGPHKANKHFLKALIYLEKNNLDLSLTNIRTNMAIRQKLIPLSFDMVHDRDTYIFLLAENNEFEKAEELALSIKREIEAKDSTQLWFYWWASGALESAKGNPEVAVSQLEKAAETLPHNRSEFFNVHYCLARAYLESGRIGDAVTELETAIPVKEGVGLGGEDERLTRVLFSIWVVKSHYLLGIAYEESGWNDKAIEQYETFLDIWKNADEGLKSVDDVKARLSRLKSSS